MKFKALLRLLAVVGIIIVLPMLIYFIFTGRNYIELFDNIDDL